MLVGANRRRLGRAGAKGRQIGLFFSEPLARASRTWGDLRLSSVPVEVQSTLATLPADAGKIAASLPLNELVRSGEFLVGVSYRVSGGHSPSLIGYAIASEGAAMPLTPTGSRFYRQYYAGVRIQSTQQRHIVDVTLGQNEAITGGRFRGYVLRVDGFYALP